MSQPAPDGSGAAASAPSAPPLAAFDTAGTASVISYQTPESTSYGGRNVLEIDDYALSDFAAVVAPTSTGTSAQAASPEPSAAGAGPVAATGPDLAASVSAPRTVLLSDSTVAQNSVIALAPFDQTARLAALTWSDVQAAAAAQKRIDMYRSIGGQLDYRVRDVSQASTPTVPQTGLRKAVVAQAPVNNGGGGGVGSTGGHPFVEVSITAPDVGNPVISGPSAGLSIQVSGTVVSTAGPVRVMVSLVSASQGVIRDAAAILLPGDTWMAPMLLTESGSFSLRATAIAIATPTFNAATTISFTVLLSGGEGGGGPAATPAVLITSPARNTVFPAPQGSVIAQVAGTADNRGGSAVTVSVSADGGEAASVTLTSAGGTTFSFATSVLLSGEGMHSITATAINQEGIAAPAVTVPVLLAASLPVRPLDRRLLLIEKISLTSYLGNFGAGRLVKTFSLLPGEQTVISVDSYTKDETTAQTASSILDSTATECAADFEDTVNNENDAKQSSADATSASISADVGASWGWGHADIKAGYTDAANSSREDMAKTVTGALAKHTSKASSNRTVSVNTDFSQTTSTGTTTDTTRTLKNINVSRVLNFVFRQMTQEHTVFIHLTDATLGYYALDLLLGANGDPQTGPDGGLLTRETFTEYSLPEIAGFAQTNLTGPAEITLLPNVLNVLSSVPDYTGTQRSLVEQITPVGPDGTPQPSGSYLRVKPNLTSTYPATGTPQYTLPGIIVDVSTCVMRTDQLICDALLGEGDALDSYSHALQDVAITERQTAVAQAEAAVAKEKLAQSIVSGKDAAMAAIWQKVFPPALSVPATVTLHASPDMAGASDDGTSG
jgi:hypothetical protein